MGWDDDPDELTPLTCAACKGNWLTTTEKTQVGTYRTTTCRWCTQGMMTPKQFKIWFTWSQAQSKKRNTK